MKFFLQLRKYLIITLDRIDSFFGLSKNKVVVLCYHSFSGNENRYSISVDEFERQILKIQKTSDFIGIDQIDNLPSLNNNGRRKVILTIDDGYKSVLKIKPIIKKYKIPVLLFIVSNIDSVNRQELDTDEALLSWKDIIKLHRLGWTIGSHSVTHSNFSCLNNEGSKFEIVNSKTEISNKIKEDITMFAFPKGNFSKFQLNVVEYAKYKYAFSILPGFVGSSSSPYQLPRTIIDKTHTIEEIPGAFSSLWFLFRNITNNLRVWDILLK